MSNIQSVEDLGVDIDTLDNLSHALSMPIPPQMHVDQLRKALPELVSDMKKHFVEATGENPWD